ncbi:MAG: hypothetical protein P8J32_08790 [bacterium]|nr:hypothetical protein [bacterium]
MPSDFDRVRNCAAYALISKASRGSDRERMDELRVYNLRIAADRHDMHIIIEMCEKVIEHYDGILLSEESSAYDPLELIE